MKALASGADGVLIAGCHPGECHYIEQNYKAMRRYSILKHTLRAMGVEPDRVRLVWASAAEGQQLAEAIDQLVDDVRKLGPLKWPGNWTENGHREEALETILKEHEEAVGGAGMSQTAEKKPAKGKLAIYWAASCGGCEISILQIDAKILDVDAAFDLVFCPCIADGKVRDIEKMADGEIDVCLFNGGIRNSEQEYMARLLRRKSKVLVAFGSCASEGCIPGLGNLNDRKSIFETVYNQGSATAPDNPQNIYPQHETQVPEGTLYLPVFYDTLKTLRQTVDVDYFLPGCPPEADNIWKAIEAIVDGQAAAQGLDDRRRYDRLRGVQAEAEREEDQEVPPHLGDHSRRRDLPAGAGPDVLRHRHAGRLRGLVSCGKLTLHRLPRPERGRGRLRLAADECRGFGHRFQRRRGNRPHHRRRHPRSRRHVLSFQPRRQLAAADEKGGKRRGHSEQMQSDQSSASSRTIGLIRPIGPMPVCR